jgi:cytoskeletal protein CcmA (bactofilin family)
MIRRIVDPADERGAALVGVLLLLMMMSALAAALGVSGHTETLVARNHQSTAQARLAAEAGINHAVEVVTTYIFQWKSNGYASADAAADGLLANTALLTPKGFIVGNTYAVAGALSTSYQAFVMDEDDPARGSDATTLTADDDPANNEDGVATTDNNRALIIRAVGSSLNNTTVTLEATIAPVPLPAVASNGNITVTGSATINGTEGDVHSNTNLTVSGSSSITGDASASGGLTCSDPCTQVLGTETSGAAPIAIPPVRASDYEMYADYLLDSDGWLKCTNPAGCGGGVMDGDPICDGNGTGCRATYGWEYNSTTTTWSINSDPSNGNGTYYVKGNASISGSPGSDLVPLQITLIAEGWIDVSGSPDLAPDTPELLFVTDSDLKIMGNVDAGVTAAGQMLVRGQADIRGNSELGGQLIIENQPVGSLLTSNEIAGNAVITYNGSLGTSLWSVRGWREDR